MIDIGDDEKIPTLEEVIKLCQQSPNMLLNIELKGPLNAEWVDQYDFNVAAEKVLGLIKQYDIADKTMISSFVPKVLQSVIGASRPPKQRNFVI